MVGRIILRRSGNTWRQVNHWSKRRPSIVISLDLHNGFRWLTRRTMSLHLIFRISCLTLLEEKLKTMNPTNISRMSAAKLSVCFDMVISKNWKSHGTVFSMFIGSGAECCCDFSIFVFFVFNVARSAGSFLFGFSTVNINFVGTESGFKRILCPPIGFMKQLASKC